MKRPKRMGYIIGIVIIFIMMAYVFWTQSTADNRLEIMMLFAVMVLFVFFGYWRLYQFYILEKLWNYHNRKDFVDYFDNMDFITGCRHFVFPLPILKKFSTNQENRIRDTINISTVMVYILFVLFIYLSPALKK